MFLWYFPAQNGNTKAPLLIWLQGGPGGSSLFGLFAENGPMDLTSDLQPIARPSTWNAEYSMLFIDNPVGAGYSYTGTGNGYCKDETCVANNLYSLLTQFYQVFTEEIPNPLFVTGESYAGHYVPAISYKIHKMNQNNPTIFINLKGLAIGDGWIDPVNMVPAYPDLIFNIGMADEREKRVLQEYSDRTVEAILDQNWQEAFEVWDEMINGDIYPYPNYFHNISGSNDYDNFLNTNAPASFDYFYPYVTSPDVRTAIHVGDLPFNDGSICESNLVEDFMKSLKPELETLLDAGYPTLIYSGQLDVIIGATLTEAFMPTVDWAGQDEYIAASKIIWYDPQTPTDVAGYVRQVRNLQQVIIKGAGHIAPADQPWRSLDMITRFVEGRGYLNG
jgi:vitellogenic carboxypeptidase-like protein